MEGEHRRHADLRGRPGARRGCRHHPDAGRAPLGPDRPCRPAPSDAPCSTTTSPTRPRSGRSSCCACQPATSTTATLASSWSQPTTAPIVDDLDTSTQASTGRRGSVRCSTGCPTNALDEVHESAEFVGELRHYQRRGLAWMQFLARVGLGGCLADDMGLGKTATTLAHLRRTPRPAPGGVPAQRRAQLGGRVARFTPGSTSRSTTAPHATRSDPALFGIADADIVITTYGLLPRDLEHLGGDRLDHRRARRGADGQEPEHQGRQGGSPAPAGQKLALTGTPVENRLSELWAILDACNPGLLGSQQTLPRAVRHADRTSQRPRRRRPPAHAHPAVRPAAHQGRPATAARPARQDRTDRLRPAHQGAGHAVPTGRRPTARRRRAAEGMQRRGRVLAALTRLKQICNHPAHALKDGSRLAGRSGKLNRFDELVDELLDVGERALVFTQFREMGDLLQRHISERFSVDAPFLHGGVSRAGRDRMVAEFQAGVGSAAAAGVAEGRRHRAQPHRRQPGDPLRPLVEPGRRGSGHRPRLADGPTAARSTCTSWSARAPSRNGSAR